MLKILEDEAGFGITSEVGTVFQRCSSSGYIELPTSGFPFSHCVSGKPIR